MFIPFMVHYLNWGRQFRPSLSQVFCYTSSNMSFTSYYGYRVIIEQNRLYYLSVPSSRVKQSKTSWAPSPFQMGPKGLPESSARNLILYRRCIAINCIKSPTRCNFSYVFILQFALYMFRADTPFIISSLHIAVHNW